MILGRARRRGAIKPPKNISRCPDCGKRVRLFVKSNGSGWDRWACSDIRGCGTSGVVLADGHLGVLERYRVRHETPLLDVGVRVLPRIVASGLRAGHSE